MAQRAVRRCGAHLCLILAVGGAVSIHAAEPGTPGEPGLFAPGAPEFPALAPGPDATPEPEREAVPKPTPSAAPPAAEAKALPKKKASFWESLTNNPFERFERFPSYDRPLAYGPAGASAPGPNRLQVGSARFAFDVAASTAYNNNVFGASRNPQGDMISTIAPSISLKAGTRGNLYFLYQPLVVLFSKFKEQNQVNQNAVLVLQYPFKRVSFQVDGFYSYQKGLYSISNGMTTLTMAGARAYALVPVGKRMNLSLGTSSQYQKSEGSVAQYDNSISFSAAYRTRTRAIIEPGVIVGRVSSATGDQDYQIFKLGGEWSPDDRWLFKGYAGVQSRQFVDQPGPHGDTLVTPVFNLAVRYKPSRYVSGEITAYRRMDSSPIGNNLVNTETGFGGGVGINLTEGVKLTTTVQFGYIEQDSPETGESDFYFAAAGVTLAWRPAEMLELRLFDNFQDRFASSSGLGDYFSNVIGAGAVIKF